MKTSVPREWSGRGFHGGYEDLGDEEMEVGEVFMRVMRTSVTQEMEWERSSWGL
jgi:hypothetical protein